MLKPNRGDVVQFTENHKWCGAFGYVEEVKKCGDDYRVMIGATIPDNQTQCSTAYIFSMLKDDEFEVLGKAVLMPKEESDE
jgi:hypothetical protein